MLLVGGAVTTRRPPTLDDAPSPRPIGFEVAAAGIYLAAPTAVHVLRGDIWKGLESLGLRIALPLVGYLVGSMVGTALDAGPRGSEDGTVGALVGGVGAMLMDTSVLAWQRSYGGELSTRTALIGEGFSF
jgi:hypothetical protein